MCSDAFIGPFAANTNKSGLFSIEPLPIGRYLPFIDLQLCKDVKGFISVNVSWHLGAFPCACTRAMWSAGLLAFGWAVEPLPQPSTGITDTQKTPLCRHYWNSCWALRLWETNRQSQWNTSCKSRVEYHVNVEIMSHSQMVGSWSSSRFLEPAVVATVWLAHLCTHEKKKQHQTTDEVTEEDLRKALMVILAVLYWWLQAKCSQHLYI